MWMLLELLPLDHPARFVAEFVDALDRDAWAELGVDIEGDSMGAPAYHPRALLSVWLYGFTTGVRSRRKLEAACWDQIPYLWLTGWQHPDHNTLWRFYRGHRQAMRKLFERTVRTAVTMKLVDLAVQAVDGTKVVANASLNRSYDAGGLRGLLERLESAITDLEAQNEAGEIGIKGELAPSVSSDATLGNLELLDSTTATASVVSLNPAFDSAVTEYTATVANDKFDADLEVTTTDDNATVEFLDENDATIPTAGTSPGNIHFIEPNLDVGDNIFKIKVTAEDATTTKTYQVTVTRSAAPGATLSNLRLLDHNANQIPLNPTFSAEETSYTATVSQQLVNGVASPAAGTIEVVWGAPGDTDTLNSYRVMWAPEGQSRSYSEANTDTGGNAYPPADATSYTITGLASGDYHVEVRARYDDNGSGPFKGSAVVRVEGTPEPAEEPEIAEQQAEPCASLEIASVGGSASNGYALWVWKGSPVDDGVCWVDFKLSYSDDYSATFTEAAVVCRGMGATATEYRYSIATVPEMSIVSQLQVQVCAPDAYKLPQIVLTQEPASSRRVGGL